mmetsp:Transcript_13840/g.20391  ORF Transcript_13840/g.20391 Transcript_13840/m.20391 type:complete len:270 (-) Transcript_13840:71-880(-)
MPIEGEVEAAEAVPAEAVGPALQHHRPGLEVLHHTRHHRFEDLLVALVVHAVLEGHVDGVVLPLAVPQVLDVAGAGEVLPELVEADGHHPVRGVERLLHAIPVVDVDVQVHHPLVLLEQLQAGEHAVVDVAEPAGLALLGVVQAPRPVHHQVAVPLVQAGTATNTAGGVELAEFEQAVKHRAILPHVEALQLAQVLLHVVLGDDPQEVDVVVAVEAGEVLGGAGLGAKNFQVAVQAIVDHQVVGHAHTMRLHWMSLTIVIIPNISIIKI